MPEVVENTIIIGSGPAGLTAAIYTARANLSPLVFEGLQPGGQLTITTEVENYPGFVDGIQGPELMDVMRRQAERFGSRHVYEFVDKVDLSERPFKVWVGGNVHLAHSLIIATGASARYLGLEDEEKFHGRGLSACATCDGFFFKDQDIAVIGGGDSAMEEATFLTKFARSVTLIHRREEFRASRIMLDRARNNDKIRFVTNAAVKSVIGDGSVTGLELIDTRSGDTQTVDVTGMFVAIGHDPRSELVRGQVDLDSDGYVQVQGRTTYTSLPGVFAAGDLVDHTYRQAITAAGSGCAAAIDAERWLAEQGDIDPTPVEADVLVVDAHS